MQAGVEVVVVAGAPLPFCICGCFQKASLVPEKPPPCMASAATAPTTFQAAFFSQTSEKCVALQLGI
jgi:hypothetical protein